MSIPLPTDERDAITRLLDSRNEVRGGRPRFGCGRPPNFPNGAQFLNGVRFVHYGDDSWLLRVPMAKGDIDYILRPLLDVQSYRLYKYNRKKRELVDVKGGDPEQDAFKQKATETFQMSRASLFGASLNFDLRRAEK